MAALRKTKEHRKILRIHLTNVTGLGALKFAQSLIPAVVGQKDFKLEEVFLSENIDSSGMKLFDIETKVTYYKRYLPNSVSRFLECTLLGSKFSGKIPLLVIGDLPIKCKSTQTVFVQSTLLICGTNTGRKLGSMKYWVARWVFKRNIKYVTNFIVQTDVMMLALINSYPELKDRVYVITPPVPSWLIKSGLKRITFLSELHVGLQLFYPAASYPHKNHKLLEQINNVNDWPVSELILTISDNLTSIKKNTWVKCVGKLESYEVLNQYRKTDALLFLSQTESFGFPLLEAMWIGLPIICPDLPYARTLCGKEAIYFDPLDITSLNKAIITLSERRVVGWWPDWGEQLESIPKNWNSVAVMMCNVTCNA